MGKSPCCDGVGLKRGPLTQKEDKKLLAYIQENGHGSWRTLPQEDGLKRCGKSCRLRWINYLRPDIKRGKFTAYEEQRIIQLHALLGNRWSVIASHLPSRTDNEIKNYWNTHIKKRLTKMGIDPITHKKKPNFSTSNPGMMKNLSVIEHIAQWESTRLEAESRSTKHPNILSAPHNKVSSSQTVSAGPSFDILKAWQSGHGNMNRRAAHPCTLSFLETAVSMLAGRESSNTETWNNGHGVNDYDNKMCDNLWSSENDNVIDGVNKVLALEDRNGDNVLPCNDVEWNTTSEENYWSDLFLSNPETLYSVVF